MYMMIAKCINLILMSIILTTVYIHVHVRTCIHVDACVISVLAAVCAGHVFWIMSMYNILGKAKYSSAVVVAIRYH